MDNNNALWNQIQGQWKQLTGNIQERWGELTNDDMDQIQGERQNLVGRIQERYGIAQAEAERQVDEWASQIKERI